jgi:enoyl-CoA hydratase/carnithine racemase
MFGFLKEKFEKQAQEAIERRARQMAPGKAVAVAKAAAMPSPASPEDERARAIARMQAQVQEFVTPERQALINNAMAVHRVKRQILDELDDESRAKLVAMAITTLLRGQK